MERRKDRETEGRSLIHRILLATAGVQQRRARLKCWCTLFTCFTTHAIHLEVVEGLDTDSFVSSLQRFMNRKGRPDEIFSDCGTNFKGTVQELKIEARKVTEFLTGKGTT